MDAVLLSASRWPILRLVPSGPFCLGSPWISLSFHHSLMSSCSCQHLLTASNSLQHTGSWDPCDELQSAVCRGGFTLSRANQGKHPSPRGRATTDRLSPSYPVITLPLPLCCKLLHLNPDQQRSRHFGDYFPICLTVNNSNNLCASITPITHNFFFFFPTLKTFFFRGLEHQAFCYASYGNTVQMCPPAGFDYFQLGAAPGGKFSGLSEFY